MKIIFVRHGKDDDNYRGGWSKMDLIPEGIEQAKQLAKHIKENNQEYQIQRIVVKRCVLGDRRRAVIFSVCGEF